MLPAVEKALAEAAEKRDGRFKNGGVPTSPIRNIWQQHHEVIRMAVLGFGTKDIAKATGFTTVMIHNILGSEVVKRQIQAMVGAKDFDCLQVKKEIESLAPLAVGVLRGIMEDENTSSRVRLSAAVDVLDRVGLAAPKVIQGSFNVTHLTPTELDELKQRARDAQMIDITPGPQLQSQSQSQSQEEMT